MPRPAPIESRRKARAAQARQRAFFDEIAPECHLHVALNHLENTRVVIKDRQGRFVWVSDSVPQRHGFSSPAEMIGLSDSDINPRQLALVYGRDDREVLQTGRPLLGKVELSFNELGMLDWYVVNKVALRNRAGKVIGLVATIQKHPGLAHLPALGGDLRPVFEHIQAHLGEPLRLAELANLGGVSPRQIERRFLSATGLSPTEFIIRARLSEACRWLRESDKPIGRIALALGFYDQSAFTRLFRKHLGITPREFRRSRANSR